MELQSELHAMADELTRQRRINDVVTQRMHAAELQAEAAASEAAMAVKLADQYANIGGKPYHLLRMCMHSTPACCTTRCHPAQRPVQAHARSSPVGSPPPIHTFKGMHSPQRTTALCFSNTRVHCMQRAEHLPASPARLAPGNTISSGRVRKTMAALQAAHRVLLSQAQLLRAVFPAGLTWEAMQQRAALKAPTAGGPEVLRFLRFHANK